MAASIHLYALAEDYYISKDSQYQEVRKKNRIKMKLCICSFHRTKTTWAAQQHHNSVFGSLNHRNWKGNFLTSHLYNEEVAQFQQADSFEKKKVQNLGSNKAKAYLHFFDIAAK